MESEADEKTKKNKDEKKKKKKAETEEAAAAAETALEVERENRRAEEEEKMKRAVEEAAKQAEEAKAKETKKGMCDFPCTIILHNLLPGPPKAPLLKKKPANVKAHSCIFSNDGRKFFSILFCYFKFLVRL